MQSRSDESIKSYLKEVIAEGLPQLNYSLRDWASSHLIEPKKSPFATDWDGKQIEDFWLVIHDPKCSYRIAYSSASDRFGIIVDLESGVQWYMGNYGSFKEAVESI